MDAVFRGGSKHSNHSDTVEKMVRHVVQRIRRGYRKDGAIVVPLDAGFFDQKLFEVFEELQVGTICSGRIYKDVVESAQATHQLHWKRFVRDKKAWEDTEFGSRRESWTRFRKAIYCRPVGANRQLWLPFVRPERVLYTNLGMGGALDEQFKKAGLESYLTCEFVMESAHGRGAGELIHRALKDFASGRMSFKVFRLNAVFFDTMLKAFSFTNASKRTCACPRSPLPLIPQHWEDSSSTWQEKLFEPVARSS